MTDDKPPDDFVDFFIGLFAVSTVLFVTGCMIWLAVTAT